MNCRNMRDRVELDGKEAHGKEILDDFLFIRNLKVK